MAQTNEAATNNLDLVLERLAVAFAVAFTTHSSGAPYPKETQARKKPGPDTAGEANLSLSYPLNANQYQYIIAPARDFSHAFVS